MSTQQRSSTAIGFTMFAAIVMMVIGVFQVIAALTALLKDDSIVFASTLEKTYAFHLNTTGWGWTHLILGVVIFLAGLGVLAGQIWARTVGVIIAGLSAIANFAFIPIYPVWAIVIIALDVAVIWALTAHGRDIASD